MVKKIFCFILLLFIICLMPIVVTLSAVEMAAYDDALYEDQFVKNEVVSNTGIELDELLIIADNTQEYLKGNTDDFQMVATINGETKATFNEQEIIHMDDVKNIFSTAYRIRLYAVIGILVFGITLFFIDRRKLYKSLYLSSAIYVPVFLSVIILMALNFQKGFIIFHEILFSNDLWLFDINNSVLINLVPLNFFITAFTNIVVYTVILSAIIFVLSKYLYNRSASNEKSI